VNSHHLRSDLHSFGFIKQCLHAIHGLISMRYEDKPNPRLNSIIDLGG
jgi:hypothetical protein